MQLKVMFKNLMPKNLLVKYYKRRRHERTTLNFDFHLTEHCNLNCSGCNHFSPLAGKKFADIESYKKDLSRLVQLFGYDMIKSINLLGGEPLLHPGLLDFLSVSRELLPETDVCILSNGVLFDKQGEAFWETCRENKIKLLITKYPVKYDYDNLEKTAEVEHVPLEFFGNTDKEEKKFYRVPLDLTGKQDKELSFVMCNRANSCIQLQDGKLFTCPTVAYIKYFNEWFDKKLEVTESDYIDIYKVNSAREIIERLSEPIPFCRYCMIKDKVESLKWSVSKKKIEEWT